MQLRYRRSAKPVAISINVDGVECADIDTLRRNFQAKDFLPLLGKTDSRMNKWLERKEETELSIDFKRISEKNSEKIELTDETYLDLLTVFFKPDFEGIEVCNLHDVLKIWWRKYSSENDNNLKYLLEYLCKNAKDCKKVYEDHPTKQTVSKYFELCKSEGDTDCCLSLYEKHSDWVECTQVFDVASDLYWKEKKVEHLFVVAKLLIEKLTKGENQQVGISCLKKAVELNYKPAIDYLAKDGPQKEMIAKGADGCKFLYNHYPTKKNFGLWFDYCLKSLKENGAESDFKRCIELWSEHSDWVDCNQFFDVVSDMFWKKQEAQYAFVIARLLLEKFKGKNNSKVGGECMQFAANLKYQSAVDYLKKDSSVGALICLKKQ